MVDYYRSRTGADASFTDGFFISPLPYPVLLLLGVILALLGLQWYVSLEEAVEATEGGMGWILFGTPVALLLLARWFSNYEGGWFSWIFSPSPYERSRRAQYLQHFEGSSPWGVAALILLVLVLLQFQSAFLDSWFF